MLLDLVLGYECNLKCDYCTLTDAMRRRNLTTFEARAAIDRGAAIGTRALQLGGGEPTIRRDLAPLIAHARARGFTEIKVQSNGLMLSYPDYLPSLIRAGLTRLAISIHAHEPPRYHRLTRVDGAFAHLERGLAHAVASGLPVEAELIAKTDTFAHLPAAARWLADRGVLSLRLWLVSLTDENAAHPESLPRMTDLLPAYRAVFDEARAAGRRAVSLHLPKCLLPGYEEHCIDPTEGGVLCVTPDAEFTLDQSRLGGQHKPDSCRHCIHDPACPGVRRDYADRHGVGELVPVRARE
ncbi:MAG: radical SAM protein [Myxococcales bacterium]|nr:radical SAM protein [Myxococcales bacterium]